MTEIEAAQKLRVSVDTLRRARQRGDIGYTRVGGRVRYTELSRAVVEVEFRHPPASELAALDGASRQDWEER